MFMVTKEKIQISGKRLTLPAYLSSLWNDAEVRVVEAGDKLIVERTSGDDREKEVMRRWKKLGGLIKAKKIPDPLLWQKKIRKEWDRKVT
jgi:hypothetical protein